MSRNEKNLTRSVRLRKYEAVYKKFMRNQSSVSKPRVHRIRHRHHKKDISQRSPSPKKKKEKKKKPLNDYQKFVKKESVKSKYQNMRGSKRLSAVATEWEIYKKKLSRRIQKYNKKGRDTNKRKFKWYGACII